MIVFGGGFIALLGIAIFFLRKKRNIHPNKEFSTKRLARSAFIFSMPGGMWFCYTAVVKCAEGSPCNQGWELNCSPGAKIFWAIMSTPRTIGFIACLLWDFCARKNEDLLDANNTQA